MKPARTTSSIVSENRRARFDFEFLEEYTAGVVLHGYEVKSAKAGRFDISGSYVVVRGGVPYLLGARIALLQPKNAPKDYGEDRTRELLLHTKEIADIATALAQKGLTCVPKNVFIKKGLVKLSIAIAKPKKNFDKKEVIRQRDLDRDMARSASF